MGFNGRLRDAAADVGIVDYPLGDVEKQAIFITDLYHLLSSSFSVAGKAANIADGDVDAHSIAVFEDRLDRLERDCKSFRRKWGF